MVAPRLQRSFDNSRPTQELQRGLSGLFLQVQRVEARLASLEPHVPIARGIVTTDGAGGASFTGFGFRKVEINLNDVRVYIPEQSSTRYEVYLTHRAANPTVFSYSVASDDLARDYFEIEVDDDSGAAIDLATTAVSFHVLVLPEAP